MLLNWQPTLLRIHLLGKGLVGLKIDLLLEKASEFLLLPQVVMLASVSALKNGSTMMISKIIYIRSLNEEQSQRSPLKSKKRKLQR
jgi:hypothetical protein